MTRNNYNCKSLRSGSAIGSFCPRHNRRWHPGDHPGENPVIDGTMEVEIHSDKSMIVRPCLLSADDYGAAYRTLWSLRSLLAAKDMHLGLWNDAALSRLRVKRILRMIYHILRIEIVMSLYVFDSLYLSLQIWQIV